MRSHKEYALQKKPQISAKGLALVMVLAAKRFPLVCPGCLQPVKDIKLRGLELVRLPCGHQVNV